MNLYLLHNIILKITSYKIKLLTEDHNYYFHKTINKAMNFCPLYENFLVILPDKMYLIFLLQGCRQKYTKDNCKLSNQ